MKTKTFFTFLTIIFLALSSCKKEKEVPPVTNKIEFNKIAIDSVGYRTVKVSTSLTSTGGNEITQHGHCWSMEPEPTVEDDKTSLGKLQDPKTFSSQIDNLDPNQKYYIITYITCKNGTIYGEQAETTTLALSKPTVVTAIVTNITYNSAVCGGNITAGGGYSITARGVCWNTSDNPTLENCDGFTEDGSGTGMFTSNITGLTEDMTYYVAAYATNEKGTAYGGVRNFNTPVLTLPAVETATVSNITLNSAQCGGNVTDDGNGTVSARGVCWNTSGDPTLENCDGFTEDGSGTGEFTSNITGLAEDTPYFVAAYATNEKGTSYGDVENFKTLKLTIPSVETATVINITYNSAQCGGNVTDDGNGTVTARGVCWNTTGSPTLENCDGFTEDGSGTGEFTSNITGLTEDTPYCVAAYATNEKGTAYGTIKQFTTLTLPSVTTGNVTNITYNSAQCGGNVTSDGNGTVIARGVCWNTIGNPTLENCDNYTTDGSGLGTYISYLTGLQSITVYYVKAYATNEEGTAYGDFTNFETTTVEIGDIYGGGIVFYLDGSGGGLVCAESDQTPGAEWGCHYTLIGGTSILVGTGAANTTAIVAGCSEENIAALICDETVLNGYSDWFLPSKDELNLMYENLYEAGIGGFGNGSYWSSSEYSDKYAWWQSFSSGSNGYYHKDYNNRVRAVRAF